MNILGGKYAWMVKIGEKGQFVIPKEAREMFDFQPGDEILVLGDIQRGIAILPKAKQQDTIKQVSSEIEETETLVYPFLRYKSRIARSSKRILLEL